MCSRSDRSSDNVQNSPGPTDAPFFLTLPSLKMTARSYSATILIQKNAVSGKVRPMMKEVKITKRKLQKSLVASEPVPSRFSSFLISGEESFLSTSAAASWGWGSIILDRLFNVFIYKFEDVISKILL